MAPLRWGILGCGKISSDFVNGLHLAQDAKIVACAARTLETSSAFAKLHGIPQSYDSYEALVSDPQVDVVYVGTVHTYHHQHAILALSHGKHVLVEKPMAMNQRDATEMVELAKSKNLFLLEGMWTRFFPAIRRVQELLKSGAIGDVHAVHSDIGFAFAPDNDRIWLRELGGGGLLDIGIYPLGFVSMAYPGEVPEAIQTAGRTSDQGVDVYAVVTLQYAKNRYGTIQYSCLANYREETTIIGSKGSIKIQTPAHAPTTLSIQISGQAEEIVTYPLPTPATNAVPFNFGDVAVGLTYEAEAVTAAIQRGERTCAEYPVTESLFMAGVMDQIRKDLGVVYDADHKSA
ncbi:unnamed protein product [Aphanomyces euteiches]|uniref:D-xylose 1-dehydrogenase (NADP(+), D-xylono-1,5-lactone-forming) n=1 Tax=Aphanomyces euteiches TaxID=100861 RepID=A0A6G0X2S0_9STRA|nr:hypothetical protein Ae201684_009246 [Aphanomyces euteiches]KAH9070634.1 hypothetical protein Ae201684P_002990 [Aphanomyces euteiches]KAH9145776.1 hypothetical protein AeRB84_010361 [Aphanomyces euteiches]